MTSKKPASPEIRRDGLLRGLCRHVLFGEPLDRELPRLELIPSPPAGSTVRECDLFIAADTPRAEMAPVLTEVDAKAAYDMVYMNFPDPRSAFQLPDLRNYYLGLYLCRPIAPEPSEAVVKGASLRFFKGDIPEGEIPAMVDKWHEIYWKAFKHEFGAYDIIDYVRKITPTLRHLALYKNGTICAAAGVREPSKLPGAFTRRLCRTELVTYFADPGALSSAERSLFHQAALNFLADFEFPMIVGALVKNEKAIELYRRLGFKDFFSVYCLRGRS